MLYQLINNHYDMVILKEQALFNSRKKPDRLYLIDRILKKVSRCIDEASFPLGVLKSPNMLYLIEKQLGSNWHRIFIRVGNCTDEASFPSGFPRRLRGSGRRGIWGEPMWGLTRNRLTLCPSKGFLQKKNIPNAEAKTNA